VVRPQARSAADDDATDSATDAGMASAIVEGMHQPRGSVVLLTMAPWGGMLSQPHATLPNTQQCLQVDRSGHTKSIRTAFSLGTNLLDQSMLCIGSTSLAHRSPH
jgi:hypothetical protein